MYCRTFYTRTNLAKHYDFCEWLDIVTVLRTLAITFVSVDFAAVCNKRHFLRPAHVFVSNWG